jgi:K+-transporting ATPase ATPase A chain
MHDLIYVFALLVLAFALAWPLGRALAWLGAPATRTPDRLDRLLARVLGPGLLAEQSWVAYARALLLVNLGMFTLVFGLLLAQGHLPLNPSHRAGLEPTLALNTGMSFATNTNLQHYAGEVALSDLAQLSLTWLQFVSAATGIAALAAIGRALGPSGQFGNFYRDFLRFTLVLLALALPLATLLIASGTPMTLAGAVEVTTLEGGSQTIARGPVAAMVAIKQLGTNGGGFFGANSTHPLECPSFAAAVLENLAILVVSIASLLMFGHLSGRMRDALVLAAVMLALFFALVVPATLLEAQPNAALAGLPIAEGPGLAQGNLEGKELRFGSAVGPVWAVTTTATSNGSVAAMHDSLNPLTGLMPMIGMWLNMIFGGVGVGAIGMLLYVVVAVFIAGLMVGRTPEYLGRKLEIREMKLAVLALLLHPLLILAGTAVFAATTLGSETVSNPGSHGFSQILYEMSSAAANNGSGFEGLADDTPAWNLVTALWMFLGRYLPIVLPLAIAASLAAKPRVADSAGTLRTDSPTFALVLLACIVLLGALLFLPAAVLGPIAEHLSLAQGVEVQP